MQATDRNSHEGRMARSATGSAMGVGASVRGVAGVHKGTRGEAPRGIESVLTAVRGVLNGTQAHSMGAQRRTHPTAQRSARKWSVRVFCSWANASARA
jgi:hypothetical protein